MLRTVTGLNEARDASTPDPNSLVGVQKLAVLNSNTATRHILEGSLYMFKTLAEALTYRIADILQYADFAEDLTDYVAMTTPVTGVAGSQPFGLSITAAGASGLTANTSYNFKINGTVINVDMLTTVTYTDVVERINVALVDLYNKNTHNISYKLDNYMVAEIIGTAPAQDISISYISKKNYSEVLAALAITPTVEDGYDGIRYFIPGNKGITPYGVSISVSDYVDNGGGATAIDEVEFTFETGYLYANDDTFYLLPELTAGTTDLGEFKRSVTVTNLPMTFEVMVPVTSSNLIMQVDPKAATVSIALTAIDSTINIYGTSTVRKV